MRKYTRWPTYRTATKCSYESSTDRNIEQDICGNLFPYFMRLYVNVILDYDFVRIQSPYDAI